MSHLIFAPHKVKELLKFYSLFIDSQGPKNYNTKPFNPPLYSCA